MKEQSSARPEHLNRRSFLQKGIMAGGAAVGAGLLAGGIPAFADDGDNQNRRRGRLPRGDVAILRFIAAAETLETDVWLQYAELGGTQDSELPGLTGGSPPYMAALSVLDSDMAQYIHDNTEDEMSHRDFINAYLASRGEEPVHLDQFATLPSSKATGAQQIGRLTNLMQLTVDTSFWTRYRSRTMNPDLDPGFVFPQAVPSLNVGQHPAIPRSDADLSPNDHIQAIANTAGFHFCFIEQAGTSIVPALAQRVTDPEVLRILLSLAPVEAMHFQTWHDKAGNAPPLTDPEDPTLTFPDLNSPPFGGEDFQTNLIMPEPVPFLSRHLPACSIVRPTETRGAAMAAAQALVADGLFIGQSPEFFAAVLELVHAADAARREG